MSSPITASEVHCLRQDIETAINTPDPVQANLLITRCHYQLSQALAAVLGPAAGANFHTWAVWGSRKAGVTIRQEDLDNARRDGTRVGGSVGGLVGLGCGWLLGFPPLWLPAGALLGVVCGITAGRLIISHSRRRSAALVLAGNRTVLQDIGLQTVRFLEWRAQAAPGKGESAAGFLAELTPGPAGGQNQELLRQAFAQYHAACEAPSPAEKKRAVYFANCFAVWHEHVRLEPYIQGAMPLIIRRCVTGRLLQFDIGAVRLAVAEDVPQGSAPAPEIGPVSTNTSDEAVLSLLRAGSGTAIPATVSATGTAAHDWTQIKQRMRYVFALFREFHSDPQVFSTPYTAAQFAAIAAGSMPAGPL